MPAHSAHRFPGPDALGRSVVVSAGAPTPEAFVDSPRLVIDQHVLAEPREAADAMHGHWLARRRAVIELAVANDALRAPEVTDRPPHALEDDFAFHRERLHVLVWANSYDLRRSEPRWWHGVLARRRAGAGISERADVSLPDGRDAWVDGGPRGPVLLVGSDAHPLVHRESVALGRLTVAGSDAPSEDLADDQLAAVRHGHGPARVIAPAGSGKTRVLTARLRHLLVDRRIEPELVTALAYNTRAAAQLRERTAGLPASIRTLHALALWICSLDERSRVIDERDVRGILDNLITTARIPNQDPYQPYLEALSEIRLALRDPVEVEAERGDVDDLPRVFAAYRQVLDDQRLLDFDEQIYRAIELLLQRPDLRTRAQRAGTHLLVDEFQDLTPAFLLLVRLVAGPTNQVFAVGDDDQTIYSYAGATPDFLVDFTRWFPGATAHALEVNYRCPPAVVAAAANLLAHNHHRVDKTIRAAHRDPSPAAEEAATAEAREPASEGAAAQGPSTRPVHRVAPEAMARRVLALVREHLDGGAPPGAFAVLARVNSALLPVQVILTEHGIGHSGPLDPGVLNRTGVRTALAYLRLGADVERIRRDDLLDTINRPARKVKSALVPLLPSGRRFSIGQLEAIARRLDATNSGRLAGYLADLRHLESRITDGVDTAACLRVIRTRIGLGEAMDALDASKSRPEGSSHGDDLDALEQLASLHPDPVDFRDWLRAALDVPADPAGVTLATVHRVKGMEWPRVVVFAANQGLFPHRLADDLEEERRVFHVALTRCTERVDIVADEARHSPFIDELTNPPPSREQLAVAAAALTRHRADAPGTRVRRSPDDRLLDVPEDELDHELFELLRSWRSRQAAETGVPAYLVLHDRHLRIITARRPSSLTELAACPGIGPTKLDRYGDDLLALIGDHSG